MRLFRAFAPAIAGLTVMACLTTTGPAAHAVGNRVWPVTGPVVRGFDPPSSTYGAGHRGIDIGAESGLSVVVPEDGVVTFVGAINYVPMLTVTHGDGVRTTYQPVTALVRQGERVVAGQPIGNLLPGHCTAPCLHFGVLQGKTYLDPLAWLGAASGAVRLLPNDSKVPPLASAGGRTGSWPVKGRVTSEYGWRIHPILGVRMFHDGIDIAAACGTPVVTPWAGKVTQVGTTSIMGNYVRVSHAGGLQTSYLHLSAIKVKVGDRLASGQLVGLVGTTGRSTGCHLHFGASRHGSSINPRTVLP